MRKYRYLQIGNEYRATGTYKDRRREGFGYSRGKRIKLLRLLMDGDSDHSKYEKSWKNKRKTQYRPDGRGAKHVVYFTRHQFREEWKLTDYLKEHDVPYREQLIGKTHTRQVLITKKTVQDGVRPWYGYKTVDGVTRHTIMGYWSHYVEVELEKPYYIERRWREILGTRITYWTNKDIGL